MKKIGLFGVFAALLLVLVSCSDTKTNNGGEENKVSYLLSKINEVDETGPQNMVEVKYASTDPAVIRELVLFTGYEEAGMGAKKRVPMTKALSEINKVKFHNFVASGNNMTFDADALDAGGVSTLIGSCNVTLNAEGAATAIKFASKYEDVDDFGVTVEYNTDGYMTKFTVKGISETEVYTFAYSGGNMTKFMYSYKFDNGTEKDEGTSEISYSEYATDNKGGIMHPALLGGDGLFDLFASLRILGKPAASLPSKGVWDDGEIDTFTYVKDANGCISMLTETYSYTEEGVLHTGMNKYSYEYIEVKAK